MKNPITDNPFASFWWGGYECTDQLNAFGNRVDFLPLTGHLQLLDADYQDLKPFNIKTVREGIRWAMIEKTPYQYDFSTVRTMLEAGQRHGNPAGVGPVPLRLPRRPDAASPDVCAALCGAVPRLCGFLPRRAARRHAHRDAHQRG
ncbi:MAG: hypothetical protein WKG07_38535 [Hymenobacter sp.]